MPKLPRYLTDEYKDIVVALYKQYNDKSKVAQIMNRDRSAVTRIINNTPKNYKPKWTKE